MTSMLENLIGSAVKRRDDKRILPVKRPLPMRQRDVLELFMALGAQATAESIVMSCDLRDAEPRSLLFVVLGRWPTQAELAEHAGHYRARQHLRSLLLGQEFRTHLVRRICDAFPERPRLLYVRIPRCAGEHFLAMANTLHAVLPPDLPVWRPRDEAVFIPAVGSFIGRFNFTKTILLAQASLGPFVQVHADTGQGGADSLPWRLNPPPQRPGDRLFTIIREPVSLILSQVNAILTDLYAGPAGRTPRSETWRQKLGPLPPPDDLAAWKKLGEAILLRLPDRNPICTALADGTAAASLQACRLTDIEIADVSRYGEWVRYKWDLEPDPPSNISRPILAEADLGSSAHAHLTGIVAEDRQFYAKFSAKLADRDQFNPFVRGRDL
jgi:hypothetical protein